MIRYRNVFKKLKEEMIIIFVYKLLLYKGDIILNKIIIVNKNYDKKMTTT